MTRDLLITGASGFIGGHVVRAALAVPGTRIRLVRHAGAPGAFPADRVRTVHADLRDASSLRGLCHGVDAVLHCASLVSGDEESLRAVNDRGTEALVADALRHGVRRVVYVSTAAVYGPGPFRQAAEHTLAISPRSATSRTRAAAERHVLTAGGTVLRPHLVYGVGDRWVIPGLTALLTHLGAAVDCASVHSAVMADALAAATLGAALTGRDLAGAWHVNHPRPVRAADLTAAALGHLPRVRVRLTPEQAGARLAGSLEATHHLSMLTEDHWFASERIWRLLDIDPGPDPVTGLARHAPWYHAHLG